MRLETLKSCIKIKTQSEATIVINAIVLSPEKGLFTLTFVLLKKINIIAITESMVVIIFMVILIKL